MTGKLFDLLQTFTPHDWRYFTEFLQSPYCNRNTALITLAASLRQHAANRWATIDKVTIWQALFPDQPLDNTLLNHHLSWLLKAAEQFLAMEKYWKDTRQIEHYTAESLSERKLNQAFDFKIRQIQRHLDQSPLRDARHHLHRYLLADLNRSHRDRQPQRTAEPYLQTCVDSLDAFYFTEKLKFTCGMVNASNILSAAYELHFVEELRQYLNQHPEREDAPGVTVYLCILEMQTRPDDETAFYRLKKLLDTCQQQFSVEEMGFLYIFAINYCLRAIRLGRHEFVPELLDLYERGVAAGFLLDGNQLSPWHFKNMVKLGLRLERFDWTEQFIKNYVPLLPDDFREDALHYNLAELYFYTNRYQQALAHLNQVEFTDVHYNLGAKVMLAKIYHETDAFEALDSLLHAFRTWVRRNKMIGPEVRKAYLNFVAALSRISRAQPDQWPRIRRQVAATEPLTSKNWLLKLLI